jgi:hypothetical protein
VVLLISSDSFRYGYQYKVPLPHICWLIAGAGTPSSPPPAAREGKGIVAVLYFATASRLARHYGRRLLECVMPKVYVSSVSGVSYACWKCFMWILQK